MRCTRYRFCARGVLPVHELVQEHRVFVVIPVRNDQGELVIPCDVVASSSLVLRMDDGGYGAVSGESSVLESNSRVRSPSTY